MAEGSNRTGALLFGRRTYLDFFGAWPGRTDGNPFTPVLNNSQKYVVSSTLREPLPWQNSTLLPGDAAAASPASSKRWTAICSCSAAAPSSAPCSGRTWWTTSCSRFTRSCWAPDGASSSDGAPPAALRLVNSVTTSTGVVIATYQPAGPATAPGAA